MKNHKLVLFIHGLTGSKESFGDFDKYILNDESLKEFDVAYYLYPTSWNPFKSPKIQSLSNGLKSDIDLKHKDYDEIVLVTHSMGGLIAKKYLLDELENILNNTIKITKVFLYAVPNIGSDLAFNILSFHPQVRQLNKNGDFLEFLNKGFNDNNIRDYIDFHYIIGSQDKIVKRYSATEIWKSNCIEIESKGHYKNGVANPNNEQDKTFLVFKELVLNKKKLNFNGQPKLFLEENTSKEEIDKLNYKNSFIPFYERDELKSLDVFFDESNKFLWMVIYGEGGSGKSRLAFEYSKELVKKCVNGGFIDINQSFIWEEWLPTQDTFLVIDYASKNEDTIFKIITILSNNQNKFRFKVRLLLLERSIDKWYDELFKGSGNINKNYLYRQPMAISNLDNTALFNIAKRFNPELDIKIDLFIDYLKMIDNKKRPLFAILLGVYLLDNELNLSQITMENLLFYYMKRNKENYWNNISDSYQSLAFILTTISKIKKDELDLASEYLPSSDAFDEKELISITNNIDKVYYKGIEPNIVGEYFILEYLSIDSKLFNHLGTNELILKKFDNLIEICWQLKSFEVMNFINRFSQDFLEKKILLLFLDKKFVKDENIAINWILSISFCIFRYVKANSFENVKVLFSAVVIILDKYKKNKAVLKNFFSLCNNLIKFMENNRNDELFLIVTRNFELKEKEIISHKIELVDEFNQLNNTPSLLSSLYNGIIRYLTEELKVNENKYQSHEEEKNLLLHKVLEKQKKLLDANPDNFDCAYSYLCSLISIQNVLVKYLYEDTIKIFNEISLIKKAFSDNEKIKEEYSKSLFNQVKYYIGINNFDKFNNILDELKSLHSQFKLNKEIKMSLYRAKVELVNYFSSVYKKDFDKAIGLYKEVAIEYKKENNSEYKYFEIVSLFNLAHNAIVLNEKDVINYVLKEIEEVNYVNQKVIDVYIKLYENIIEYYNRKSYDIQEIDFLEREYKKINS